MSIETVNPATGKLIHAYSEMPSNEVDGIIDNCHNAFLTWREMDFAKRAKPMLKLAEILKQRKNELATLIANEMGKPLSQGVAEIEKCAMICEHYAKNASDYLKSKIIQTEMQKSFVTYQPLGVIFAIMPWNFPFWQVFRFAVPTLMAGNAGLLKHAAISTGSSLIIEQLFLEAGFSKNLFRSLIIQNEAAASVIANPKIKAVSLTGSTRAGKIVASLAAKEIKHSVLELGGSDPYLILEDADLEMAAVACVTSRMNNAGQSCIAAKRFITVGATHDKFIELIQQKLQKYKMGDPLDAKNNIGPLARKDLRETLHAQVEKSIAQGAKLIVGGVMPTGDGFYYPPTLLINVAKGMPAYDEELFGPVISIIHVATEKEAIDVANDTSYGLGSGIFSKDIQRAEKIAVEQMNAGTCAINTFVASDPRVPFGGINQSGYGRELGFEGITSFVNVKTVHIS